jgi:CheY-like chemotaxis protein
MTLPAQSHIFPSVLLVEDDHALARVWKTLFEMLDYNIVCYHMGTELLREWDKVNHYDVIITDYYLPDINGVELIKEVRERTPGLPAIVLTGSQEKFIQDAVREISNCHILYKPLNMSDIEAKLAEILPAN